MTDETLRQAVLAFLERAPSSEIHNEWHVAKVLAGGEFEYAFGRRVHEMLITLVKEGSVKYLSHRGYRLIPTDERK